MQWKDLLTMAIGGLFLGLLVVTFTSKDSKNSQVSEVKTKGEARVVTQAYISEPIPVEEQGIEKALAECEGDCEKKVSELEFQVNELQKSLVFEKKAREDLLQITNPAPSQRYSFDINYTLKAVDDYLAHQRFQLNRQQVLIDQVSQLYKTKGLSGSQNNALLTAFQDLVEFQLGHVSQNIENMGPSEIKEQILYLDEISELRHKSGKRWMTDAQLARVSVVKDSWYRFLERSVGIDR